MEPVPVVDAVAFDCADPDGLGQFWQALLGGDLRPDHDGGHWQVMQVPEGNEFCIAWGGGHS